MDKITRDAEEIEQTIAGYHDQTHRMKQQQVKFVIGLWLDGGIVYGFFVQAETEDLVRKAQVEIDRIHQEKKNIMQKWTSTVINIAKRDEALVSFKVTFI